MPTYYEILNVPTTASAAEIQTAHEQQYNKWRRLVTHHDPNVVNQANQALQALETIRATLTDPSKRSAYDAGIGLGNVGGLADPEAVLGMSSPRRATPPLPKTSSAPVAGAPSLWTCPKCGTDNPEHTQYCFKCATQLVRECPSCKNMSSLISTGICGKCGTHFETFVKRMELIEQRAALISNRMALEQSINSLSTQAFQASRPAYESLLLPVVLGIGFLVGSCLLGAIPFLAPSIEGLLFGCLVSSCWETPRPDGGAGGMPRVSFGRMSHLQ
jgi:YD repeat-containing protein